MQRRVYVETFDHGAAGWVGWSWIGRNRETGPVAVEVHDSLIVSRSPWWVDPNHTSPQGGHLHILFGLHLKHYPDFPKEVLELGGTNPYVEAGFPTNLTNATLTVRLKGDVKLRGAQLLLHVQANVPTASRPVNVVNQVLIGQPLTITRDWSEQTLHLVPDQTQWRDLGSHSTRRDRFGHAPIAEVLRDVNCNIIFVLFPLDVVPRDPQRVVTEQDYAERDFEVDPTRLPEGHVMLDEVRIEFP